MKYLEDADFTLYQGDVREVLRSLPDGSVDCCVTSPPYWGLRDYGTGTWDGGDPGCDHRTETEHQKQGATSMRQGRSNVEDQRNENFRDVCGKCGATRRDSQIGLEQIPADYVAEMVAVFREVRRVLADHGTCWLNLGDSYASGEVGRVDAPDKAPGLALTQKPRSERRIRQQSGLKPKDLVGIPWRVAFALQDDGWWLRSDIIWAKPNPMPESVTDRPTKAHEYVFLLSKQPRYFFDQEAVREPHSREWWSEEWRKATRTRGLSKGWNEDRGDGGAAAISHAESGRNVRSVWEIATQPYAEAHFATFPLELPRRCIAAGCPEGGTVLDPFMGSGTTALVARQLGRKSIGVELNPEYCALAARRLQQQSLFAGEAA